MTRDLRCLPKIAITLGDPAGIGPEVVVKALADPALCGLADWLVVGDLAVLGMVETAIGKALAKIANVSVLDLKQLDVSKFVPGTLNAECGRAALEYVRVATQLCLRGEADALVTAPVNKEAVISSGATFTGHTEFIADLCGVSESRMLLLNEHLGVVHVSTHVSLRNACKLDSAKILRTIELGHEAMQRIGVVRPRIAVCGLNPHAGENGIFGSEEREFILPAIESARVRSISCEGPFPADTVFMKAARGSYDLVVAMYHDQGHIPMKLLDFEHTVNISLGLPILRTSVDHGTAFDIVGRNQADPSSMKAAMKFATVMAAHRITQRR